MSIRLKIELKRQRKSYTIESTTGQSQTLKAWCDAHSVSYQAMLFRLDKLPLGTYYDKIIPALRAIVATKKARARAASERAARGDIKITALQERVLQSALKSMAVFAETLGYRVTFEKITMVGVDKAPTKENGNEDASDPHRAGAGSDDSDPVVLSGGDHLHA